MAYKVKSVLPDQTGNANKFLKTDGTNTSWAAGGSGSGDLVSTNNLSDVANAATDILLVAVITAKAGLTLVVEKIA